MSQQKSATVRLQDGMHFIVETDRGNQLSIDSAINNGGRGKGDSPMTLLLAGLAGCTAMDVASILRKMREPLAGLQVSATGTRAEEHPRVYTEIHLEYIVEGENIKSESVEKAIELSVNRYCSASAMLKKTAELKTSFTVTQG